MMVAFMTQFYDLYSSNPLQVTPREKKVLLNDFIVKVSQKSKVRDKTIRRKINVFHQPIRNFN